VALAHLARLALGRLLFVLIVLAHDRRRIVHVAVTEHLTAAWTAQQLRNAFSERDAPQYLLHDRDSVFADVAITIAGMNMQRVRTAAIAVAERLRGTRHRLDPTRVPRSRRRGQRRAAASSTDGVCYLLHAVQNAHLALEKDAPISRPVTPASGGRVVVTSHFGGLHHRYDIIGSLALYIDAQMLALGSYCPKTRLSRLDT